MATKSAIMRAYRALISRRIWDVNDAIEEHTGKTLYNEAAALVDATHKDIQVLIDIYEPCIESDAKNKVSDDTIETLSVSKVDAEGEVFGDANETHKLEGTILPLLIHEPSKCEILLNDV